MKPYNLLTGLSEEVLKTFPENNFDSCVTDCPYGISIMNKKWDYTVPSKYQWEQIYRVLKPGAYLVCFGGPRTYHRVVCNIEDAGFEIRDQIFWVFSSGFPKTPTERYAENIIGGEKGRWPANLIHDGSDEVLALFPESKGQQGNVTGQEQSHTGNENTNCYGEDNRIPFEKRDDSGSAARFFYCAKTSKRDRNEGCENFISKPLNWSSGEKNPGTFQSEGTNKSSQNSHPTVKPTELMRYLCRLVTPPSGHILDPFGGSGSTGKAAIYENFNVTLIDSDEQWMPIQKARCEYALRNKNNQTELF